MTFDKRWLHPVGHNQIRRSSSLQLSSEYSTKQPKTLFSVISTLKASSNSIYTSTLTATSIIGGWRQRHIDEASLNLYTVMAKYRCCCGLCRLRVGSFTIGIISIVYPVCVIGCLYSDSLNILTDSQRRSIRLPMTCAMTYQLIASILMLTGIFIDVHYLLLPFQASCIFNVMLSMGLGILLLMSADRTDAQVYPLIAVLSAAFVAIFIWFLVICSMTFVLLRDKKNLDDATINLDSEVGDSDKKRKRTAIERVNSALF